MLSNMAQISVEVVLCWTLTSAHFCISMLKHVFIFKLSSSTAEADKNLLIKSQMYLVIDFIFSWRPIVVKLFTVEPTGGETFQTLKACL